MIQSQVWQESWEEPPWSSNRALRNPNTWARCRAGLWLPCTEHHFPAIESEDLGIHKSIILGVAPLAKFLSICSHTFVPRSLNSAFVSIQSTLLSQAPRILTYISHCSKHPAYPGEKSLVHGRLQSVYEIFLDIEFGRRRSAPWQPWPLPIWLFFFSDKLQIMGMVASLWYLVGKSPQPSTHKFVPRCGC